MSLRRGCRRLICWCWYARIRACAQGLRKLARTYVAGRSCPGLRARAPAARRCFIINNNCIHIRRPHKGRCSEPRRAPKYAGLPVPLPRAAGLQDPRISSYKLQELQVYKLQETRKGKEGCYKNCKSRVVISWFLRDVRYVKKSRCVSESIRE